MTDWGPWAASPVQDSYDSSYGIGAKITGLITTLAPALNWSTPMSPRSS